MGKGLLERFGLRRRPPMALDAFRERVAEAILLRRHGAELLRVGEAELELVGGAVINVARSHAQYLERPGELRRLLDQLADLILQAPPEATPDALIVLVRPVSFMTGEDGGVFRRLPQGLIGIVAVDTPARYVFAPASRLRADLEMDDAAIWDLAISNLRTRLDMTPPAYQPGRVMGIKSDIGLAASLIVEDLFWNHPRLASLGELVVAPLERDELIVAPRSAPELVDALRRIAAERSGPNLLTGRLLLRRDGAWEAFD